MAGELAGRRALVTGGASGIGRAIADTLAGRGARVAVLDRDLTPMSEGPHLAVAADLRDDAEVRRAVTDAVAASGEVAAVVVAHPPTTVQPLFGM